jgi:hypothetical protein
VGQLTASDESLDADVILAAQATILNEDTDDDVVVATTNPRHLSRFVDARIRQEIAPWKHSVLLHCSNRKEVPATTISRPLTSLASLRYLVHSVYSR